MDTGIMKILTWMIRHRSSFSATVFSAMTPPTKIGEEIGDPTETALINQGDKLGRPAEVVRDKYPRCSEVPFDSDRKMMSTLHNLREGATMITKGAVDVLLNRVCSIQKDSGIVPITEEDRRAIEEQNQKFSRKRTPCSGICL